MLAQADPTPFTINPTTFPAARFDSIGKIVNLLLPLAMLGGVLLFLVVIIQAAFIFLTSEGKAEKANKARDMFIFAIIGLVVVLSAYILVKLIALIFNIQGLPL